MHYAGSVGDPYRDGRRIALISVGISAVLASVKITAGVMGHSTAVVADGVESAGDVFASGLVVWAMSVASRPPDDQHPYGHGRLETLTGLAVGLLLAATGSVLIVRSLDFHGEDVAPAAFTIWPMLLSIAAKSFSWGMKRRWAKRIKSDSLEADANNDAVDILSGIVALGALGLALWEPERFAKADNFGGAAIGVIVVILGIRVVWETALQLMDTMPDAGSMEEIKQVALSVPGALGIEKCFARKTGLQYHVDLHLEVDGDLSVHASHEIASRVRSKIKEELEWVADVLVHVEPYGLGVS